MLFFLPLYPHSGNMIFLQRTVGYEEYKVTFTDTMVGIYCGLVTRTTLTPHISILTIRIHFLFCRDVYLYIDNEDTMCMSMYVYV